MFQHLTDLLFGRLHSGTHGSALPKSGGLEGEEEEWLLVGIPDGEPVELNPVPSSASVSRSVQAADSTKATDSFISTNSMEDPGLPAAQDSGPVSRSSAPQAKSVQMG